MLGLVPFYDADGEFMCRCSGSLITPTTFLTAGHCTDQNAEESPVKARIWFHQNDVSCVQCGEQDERFQRVRDDQGH
jgi:V8-like Glu-specific endopeptidase